MFEGSSLTAGDVLTGKVISIAPDASLREAARLMAAHRVSALPVVDRGVVVGMISEIDLLQPDRAVATRRGWWLHNLIDGVELAPHFLAIAETGQRTVRHAMQGDVVWVPETAPLAMVARVMPEKGIRRVVVERDGRLIGIISRRDLLRAMAGGAAE